MLTRALPAASIAIRSHSIAIRDSPHKAQRPYLWLKVTDRGVGISREALDRVRQLFQQADNSITRRYGGSGLGLSVSSELAALLGGELVYASAEGVGSIFVAAVPCTRPPSGRTPGPSSRVPSNVPATSRGGSSSSAGASDSAASGVVKTATSVAAATSPAHLRSRFQPSSPHTPTPEARTSDPAPAAASATTTSLLRSSAGAATEDAPTSAQPSALSESTRPPQEATSARIPASSESSTASQAARRPTVLVVDDNAVNVMVLQRQLALLQCDTLVASDGQAAVDVVRTMLDGSAHSVTSLDLILMDLHMPNMNGFEASRAIRALERVHRPTAPPVPIITVSADSEEAMGELAREAGMQAYLRKPFVLSDVRGLLERWVPR